MRWWMRPCREGTGLETGSLRLAAEGVNASVLLARSALRHALMLLIGSAFP